MDPKDPRTTTSYSNRDTTPSPLTSLTDSDQLNAWLSGGATTPDSNLSTVGSSASAATVPTINTAGGFFTNPAAAATTTTTAQQRLQRPPQKSPPLPPRSPPPVPAFDDRAATTETTHHEPTIASTIAGGRAPAGVLRNTDRFSATSVRPKTEEGTAASDSHAVTTGDEAEASASASQPTRMPSHQRKVSWGDSQQQQQQQQQQKQRSLSAEMPAVTSGASSPTSPLSPPIVTGTRGSLSDVSSLEDTGSPPQPTESRHSRMMSALTYSSRQMTTSTMDSLQGANIVNLDAILKVNPLESEAETLILKAIESQDAVNRTARARADSAVSNLLPNVPPEAINIFGQPDTLPAPQSSESLLVNNSNVGRPPSLHTSTESRRTTTSKPPPKIEPTHRSNQTMEQTLAGLSQALMRTATQGSASGADSRIAEQQSGAPTNAGVALAKNVSVLFGERQKTSGSAIKDPVPATPLSPLSSVGVLGRQKTSGSATKIEATDSGDEAPSSSSSLAGGKNWNKLRNLVRVTSVSSQHQQPAIGDDDPSNGSRKSATETTPGYHHKTDSNIASDICDRIEETGEEDVGDDDVEVGAGTGASGGGGKSEADLMQRKRPRSRSKFTKSAQVVTKNNLFRDFRIFLSQRRASFFTYLRILFLLEIPAVAVAFLLFYAIGNPPTGRVDLSLSEGDIYVREGDGEFIDPLVASASWWILFICVRQGLMFTLAQLLEVIVIDFFCLSSRLFVSMCGNLVTLLIVQARGWPFLFLMWGILDFALLYGSSRFANHWLWYQDFIRIFNESNPGGSITSSIWYTRVLAIAVSVSVVVSIKRLWLGLYLGKKTFKNYAEDLAKVVQKLVTLADVASLARMFQAEAMVDDQSVRQLSVSRFGISREEFDGMVRSTIQAPGEEEAEPCSTFDEMNYSSGRLVDPEDCDAEGDLSHSQRQKIKELLGEWEEPENSMAVEDDVSIGGILQFRHSLSFLDGRYMFSIAWGDVSTRERAVLGSQEVYRRLLLRTPDLDVLKFDVLALAATRSNSDLNVSDLKNLIRLFRPDRDGKISLLDFVKSVDSVYKEARLLRASVRNSEKIDRAFENAINVVFYLMVACVVLSQIGFDPLSLFLSLSSIILAFAFMIGSASSKMFEGWLFILLRRPYDIGDRIHVSDPESDTSANGSASWIVKDVNLFSTTAIFATTNERATLSNGSLANSRIINMARSPNAVGYIYFKFATGVPYERVQIFEKALTQFIKDRPREWVGILGFRATQVMADLGYIEYVAVLQHRESWQNVTTYLVSKAQVASFCLELSKKLNMRYQSPPLPVNLALVKNYTRGQDCDPDHRMEGVSVDDTGIQELVALFESKKDK